MLPKARREKRTMELAPDALASPKNLLHFTFKVSLAFISVR
jgi:hypothetical protein